MEDQGYGRLRAGVRRGQGHAGKGARRRRVHGRLEIDAEEARHDERHADAEGQEQRDVEESRRDGLGMRAQRRDVRVGYDDVGNEKLRDDGEQISARQLAERGPLDEKPGDHSPDHDSGGEMQKASQQPAQKNGYGDDDRFPQI